jgi:hypothetical protein
MGHECNGGLSGVRRSVGGKKRKGKERILRNEKNQSNTLHVYIGRQYNDTYQTLKRGRRGRIEETEI